MEHTVPALVIAAVLVLGAVTMDRVGQSWREIEAISEERLGTELTVVSTQVGNGGADVSVVLGNQGRTPIMEPSLMDVIINYTGTDSTRYQRWLPYTAGPLSDNTWTVASIANDYRNPGVLDNGEEMTIQIRLNPATGNGPDRWLVIATDTGIAYSVYF